MAYMFNPDHTMRHPNRGEWDMETPYDTLEPRAVKEGPRLYRNVNWPSSFLEIL